MMLMAWGPFRFTVPTYSVETLRRSLQSRVEEQPIIGAAPINHRLGPGNEEVVLESTFFPAHLNGRGLQQLSAVREAVRSMQAMQLVHLGGSSFNIFGSWVGISISNEETIFDRSGTPQQVTVTLTLRSDDPSPARRIALGVGSLSFSASLDSSGFSASLRLGF